MENCTHGGVMRSVISLPQQRISPVKYSISIHFHVRLDRGERSRSASLTPYTDYLLCPKHSMCCRLSFISHMFFPCYCRKGSSGMET